MDSSESPVHGQQEGGAYNGHFESVCYHPLFLFNASLKVDFQGSRVTSDGGLILIRELDERLGVEKLIEEQLSDSGQGLNKQCTLADLLRQSMVSRMAAPTTGTSSRSATTRCFCSIVPGTAWQRSCARATYIVPKTGTTKRPVGKRRGGWWRRWNQARTSQMI